MSNGDRDVGIAFMILFVVIIIIVFSLASLCIHIEHNHMDSLYNNGTCLKCGGNYSFFTVVADKSVLYYVYMCDNCKNIVKTNDYR